MTPATPPLRDDELTTAMHTLDVGLAAKLADWIQGARLVGRPAPIIEQAERLLTNLRSAKP